MSFIIDELQRYAYNISWAQDEPDGYILPFVCVNGDESAKIDVYAVNFNEYEDPAALHEAITAAGFVEVGHFKVPGGASHEAYKFFAKKSAL